MKLWTKIKNWITKPYMKPLKIKKEWQIDIKGLKSKTKKVSKLQDIIKKQLSTSDMSYYRELVRAGKKSRKSKRRKSKRGKSKRGKSKRGKSRKNN